MVTFKAGLVIEVEGLSGWMDGKGMDGRLGGIPTREAAE